MFSDSGITAVRRTRKRIMEKLLLTCGGICLNSIEDLEKDTLGFVDNVNVFEYEDDKFTFIEGGSKYPHSCSIFIKSKNEQEIEEIENCIISGLNSIKNQFIKFEMEV